VVTQENVEDHAGVAPSSSTATLLALAYLLDSQFFSFPFQVLVLDEVSMIQVRLLR
jgi:hypothetical protein